MGLIVALGQPERKFFQKITVIKGLCRSQSLERKIPHHAPTGLQPVDRNKGGLFVGFITADGTAVKQAADLPVEAQQLLKRYELLCYNGLMDLSEETAPFFHALP